MPRENELSILVADEIKEGELRIEIRYDEARAEANLRFAEANAEMLAKWQPLVDAIKDSIPPWAHQFLTHPLISPDYYSDHQWFTRSATIAIPDTATIFAYGATSSPVRFRPACYVVSDDDETWDVIELGGQQLGNWEQNDLTNDFHMALAVAAAEHKRIPELKAEADRRNAERAEKAAVEQPPTRVEHDWVGLARLAVGKTMADGNEAAIAYALIGILEQLQKVTTPLYGGTQHAIQTFDNSRGQL